MPMSPMPSGTHWNIDWEDYFDNPTGSGITILSAMQKREFIAPFIDAVNQRGDVTNAVGAGRLVYPASGVVTTFQRFRHHTLNGNGLKILQTEVSNLHNTIAPDDWLATSTRNAATHTLDPFETTFNTTRRTTGITSDYLPASGANWADIQRRVIFLASYYVGEVGNLDVVTPLTSGSSYWPQILTTPYSVWQSVPLTGEFVPYGNNGSAGIIGEMEGRLPDADRSVPSSPGTKNNSFEPGSGLFYFRDRFPLPSGFRRRFPREIWSSGMTGLPGQRARFSYRLASGEFETVGISELNRHQMWYSGRPGDQYYGSGVKTPHHEMPYFGKMVDYVDGSGWVVSNDQITGPDIVETYGIIHPGDYLGGWILNDLRDAINQLETTWGITQTNFGIPFNLIYNAAPSFNIYPHNRPGWYGTPVANYRGLVMTPESYLTESIPECGYTYPDDYPTTPEEEADFDVQSIIDCVWDGTLASGTGDAYKYYTLVGPGSHAMTPEPDMTIPPFGSGYTLAIENQFAYYTPSGHYSASGIPRTYEFYAITQGAPTPLLQLIGNTTWEYSDYDSPGEYLPATGAAGISEEEYYPESFATEDGDPNENMIGPTVLLGDVDLEQPDYGYLQRRKGYFVKDVFAIVNWEFDYNAST